MNVDELFKQWSMTDCPKERTSLASQMIDACFPYLGKTKTDTPADKIVILEGILHNVYVIKKGVEKLTRSMGRDGSDIRQAIHARYIDIMDHWLGIYGEW